jgi:hypothetical protein
MKSQSQKLESIVRSAAKSVFNACGEEVPITELGERFKEAIRALCEADREAFARKQRIKERLRSSGLY